MTATYHNYRTLDVVVPANDWSSTIELAPREGVAVVHFPTGWTLASLYWAISPDGGLTFVQVYDFTTPLMFHSTANAGEAHDNLFSPNGQWDRQFRVMPTAPQSGPMTVTMQIVPFITYHALGLFIQSRLRSERLIPAGLLAPQNASDDEYLLGGGIA